MVFGDGPKHIFPVKIAGTESVGALKKAIKIEKQHLLQHVDADNLDLWKVSLPVDESLKENLINLFHEESLSPVDGLSSVFPNMPKERYLHIVVNESSIEPGEADDELLAMVNSVYHIS